MSLTILSTQGLIPGYDETISVVPLQSHSCKTLRDILDAVSDTKVLGVCLRLSKKGSIEALALGTPTVVFLISFAPPSPPRRSRKKGRNSPLSRDIHLGQVLENPHCLLAGFHMPRIALLLHRQTSAHVYSVDLTTLHSKATHKHVSAADLADAHLSTRVDKHRIHALWLRDSDDDICLRAWLSAWYVALATWLPGYTLTLGMHFVSLAEKRVEAITKAAKVDTRHLPQHQLACLAQLVLNVELLEKDKPTVVDNDLEDIGVDPRGQVILHNKRFRTRVRKSRQVRIQIQNPWVSGPLGNCLTC